LKNTDVVISNDATWYDKVMTGLMAAARNGNKVFINNPVYKCMIGTYKYYDGEG
jgi:hypothetical protein